MPCVAAAGSPAITAGPNAWLFENSLIEGACWYTALTIWTAWVGARMIIVQSMPLDDSVATSDDRSTVVTGTAAITGAGNPSLPGLPAAATQGMILYGASRQ